MNNCGCNSSQTSYQEFPIEDNGIHISSKSIPRINFPRTTSENDLKKKVLLDFCGILKKLKCGVHLNLSFLLEEISLISKYKYENDNSIQGLQDVMSPIYNEIHINLDDLTIEEIDDLLLSYKNLTIVLQGPKGEKGDSGVNLKTINGLSLLGEGDIQVSAPLGGYLTMEDLISYMNPLKVTAQINPTLTKYTGENVLTTVTIQIKKGDTIIENPDSITITLPGEEPLEINSKTFTTNINHLGESIIQISCNYKNETDSTSVSTLQTLPTYIGFDSSNSAADINIANLSEKILSRINMEETLNNQVAGNYLWIVSPYLVTKVATDSGFTFTVAMESKITIDGLNYYRSSDLLDISNITYYIK